MLFDLTIECIAQIYVYVYWRRLPYESKKSPGTRHISTSSPGLISFIENEKRKSIPIEYFRKYGYLIKHKLRPLVDYLEYVDKYIEGVKWYYEEKIN